MAARSLELGLGLLTCLGRHTVTGMIVARGGQFTDWTASYRLFSENRVSVAELFGAVRREVTGRLMPDQMLVVHMDDTLIRKTGKKIPGTAWRRDPLGPPFQTNLVWGQRFIQLSMVLPDRPLNSQSRAIPVAFHHCPGTRQPGRDATADMLADFREKQRQAKLSKQGAGQLALLRRRLDDEGHRDRVLHVSVDGSYTNRVVLKGLPRKTVLIGRIRKDTKLYKIPVRKNKTGRKKVYGDQIPTPEQVRQSDAVPWQPVVAWAAGKSHSFDVKVVRDLRWRPAGAAHDIQLVIIRPLAYRLTKGSKLLYRQPAYLICTDNGLGIEQLLQAYLWRWEIEVNFRDEKTVMGCGEAQVRNENSAGALPAFGVAMYSLMLLAANEASKTRDSTVLPRPLWDPAKDNQRLATNEMANLMRAHLWAHNEGGSLDAFIENEHLTKSLRNSSKPNVAAVLYYRK